MQKNIAFYISDYNMEHALRTVPIIENMLKLEENLRVFVKTGQEQAAFMEAYLKSDDRLRFCVMEMKDREIDCFDEMAEREIVFLKEKEIGLVVSDICPWIFIAADELRVKSVLIGNYTWAELSDTEEEQEEYLSCYELASGILIYDLYAAELTGYGVEYELVSMVNRPYDMKIVESLEQHLSGQVVFVDVPDGEEVDVSGLPYYFLVTENTRLKGANVTVLESGLSHIHNYVAASAYVISYASFNRIAEVVLANRKAAFLQKEDLPFCGRMMGMLRQRGQCILVSDEDAADIAGLIRQLKDFSYSYDHEYYNSDYDLAKKILFAYPEKRRRTRS